MIDVGYAETVRHNLVTLVAYSESIDQFATRHEAELREALSEALSLSLKLGMSWMWFALIVLTGVFRPVLAIRQVQRFLERTPVSGMPVQA